MFTLAESLCPCAYVKINDEDGERAAQGEKTHHSAERKNLGETTSTSHSSLFPPN